MAVEGLGGSPCLLPLNSRSSYKKIVWSCGTRRNLLGTWQVRKTLLSIKWKKLQRVMKSENREGPGKKWKAGIVHAYLSILVLGIVTTLIGDEYTHLPVLCNSHVSVGEISRFPWGVALSRVLPSQHS